MSSRIEIEDVLKGSTKQPMPVEMRERILRNLREAAEAMETVGSFVPPSATDQPQGIRPQRLKSRRMQRIGSLLAGAAAIVIVGAGAVMANDHGVFAGHKGFAGHGPIIQGAANSSMTMQPTRPTVVAKQLHTKNMNITYPQVVGVSAAVARQVNAVLKQTAMPPNNDTSLINKNCIYTASFSVSYEQGSLIDCVISSETKVPGTNIDVTSVRSAIVNVGNGHHYGLSDLFTSSSNKQEIAKMITAQANADKDQWLVPIKSFSQYDSMILTPSLIGFVFPKYEHFAGVLGNVGFGFPYAKVSPFINRQGEFWKALQSSNHSAEAAEWAADLKKMHSLGYQLDGNEDSLYEASTTTSTGAKLYAFVGQKPDNVPGGIYTDRRVFFFLGTKYLKSVIPLGEMRNMYPLKPGEIEFKLTSGGATMIATFTWNGKQLVQGGSKLAF